MGIVQAATEARAVSYRSRPGVAVPAAAGRLPGGVPGHGARRGPGLAAALAVVMVTARR